MLAEGEFNQRPYDRTKWYSVVNEAILGEYDERCTSIGPNGPMDGTKRSNGRDQTVPPIPPLPSSTNPIKKDTNVSKEIARNEIQATKTVYGEYGLIFLTQSEYDKLLQGFGTSKKKYPSKQALMEGVDILEGWAVNNKVKWNKMKDHYKIMQGWVYDKIIEKHNAPQRRLSPEHQAILDMAEGRGGMRL